MPATQTGDLGRVGAVLKLPWHLTYSYLKLLAAECGKSGPSMKTRWHWQGKGAECGKASPNLPCQV